PRPSSPPRPVCAPRDAANGPGTPEPVPSLPPSQARRPRVTRAPTQTRARAAPDNRAMTDSVTDADAGATDARQPTPFEMLGGLEGVRALVDRFYDLMDLEPEFAELRALHPTTLEGSRDKFAWFLTGWLGGPDLYVERFGHPRLRMRHFPYAIGIRERDQWLTCMGLAMA